MRRQAGCYVVDVHPDRPWCGALFALIDRCPPDRPVHFRGWVPIRNIYDGDMCKWEVRWYENSEPDLRT